MTSVQSELDGEHIPPGEVEYLSRAATCQLYCIIKEGIRAGECILLETLERYLYESKGPGENNYLALWMILWTLILTYRDCMASHKIWSLAPTTKDYDIGT
jgi:hypothetical protein